MSFVQKSIPHWQLVAMIEDTSVKGNKKYNIVYFNICGATFDSSTFVLYHTNNQDKN